MDKGILVRFLYGAWLSGMLLQLLLGGVLLYKKTWRLYPVFTGYTIFCLVQAALGFAVRLMPQMYLYIYLCCETIGFMLGLGVIYEVFSKLLASYPALSRVASTAFKATIVLLLAIAAAVVFFHAPVQGSRLVAGFVILEQATRIAQLGLIVFLFSFSSIFGLHWRQNVFGVTVGLAVFITVELLGITLRAHYGNVAMPVFAVARSVSFNCSLLIWLGYVLAPEGVTKAAELPRTAQLEQWNQAIMELIHQ